MMVLEVNRLCKSYGKHKVLDQISFGVEKGEIFAVTGPNGAGKTTLLEICEGLRSADSGKVTLFGLYAGTKALKMKIGVQLEKARFDKDLRVGEILELYGAFYHDSSARSEIARMLDLTGRLNSFYGSLSKGWQQRVAIAVSMIHQPELLFFDEITTGLDPEARIKLWDILKRIKNQGRSIVLTTHYMDEVENLADKMVIINNGRILTKGTLASIKKDFPYRYKMEFFTDMEPDNYLKSQEFFFQREGVKYTVWSVKEPEKLKKKLEKDFYCRNIVLKNVDLQDIYLFILKRGVSQ